MTNACKKNLVFSAPWRLLATVLLFSGCLEARDNDDTDTDRDDDDMSCELCHSIDDIDATHLTHLSSEMDRMAPIVCTECHPGTKTWLESGHMNGEVDVDFSSAQIATAQGAAPTYENGTCKNVYCHGATLSGGNNISPTWGNHIDAKCGMCHSIPPTENHLQVTDCETCHGDSFTADGLTDLHINGQTDLSF